MLKAQLFVLNTVLGSDSSNQVTVGLIIEEDDPALPVRNIAGSLNWGDGTAPFAIAVQSSLYNSASAVQLIRKENAITLTLIPPAYKGTFELRYDGVTNTPDLEFGATADDIQNAIAAVLQAGESVIVQGSTPQWILMFDSISTANKIAVGPDTLFGPVILPVHSYSNGNFLLSFTVHNYRSPIQDKVEVSQQLTLVAQAVQIAAQPILIGPILPADVGVPNPSQWNFNISVDLQVLVSNIKMILIVEPGERLMMPDYGASLRQFIFEPMDNSAKQDVENEIRRAIETWEPRVKVDSISVTKQDQRTLQVQVIAVSKLDQEQFQLNVELER